MNKIIILHKVLCEENISWNVWIFLIEVQEWNLNSVALVAPLSD